MNRMPRPLYLVVGLVYALILIPLVVVLGVSVNPTAAYEFPPTGFSLKWYAAFFATPSYVTSFFQVSLAVALVVAVLATLLGTLAAVGIVRMRFRGREALETFFLAPMLTPQILLGMALYLLFRRLAVDSSIATMAAGHLVIAVPYVMRTVTAGLAGMDPRLEEAAMSLGANRLTAFLKVTLPLLRSGIVSGAVFAFIVSFGDINLALFLSGPQSTTFPVHLFSIIHWGGDPTVAAASTLQILLIGALIFLVQRIFKLRFMI